MDFKASGSFGVCCAETDTMQHIKAAIIMDFFIVV
jgi:hypothetical protein